MKINSTNEAIKFDSLKEFYISEIKKKGSLNSISLSLGEDGRYVWSVINRSNGIDNIRALYYRLYPERLAITRVGRDS
jgi:hypothetical protein